MTWRRGALVLACALGACGRAPTDAARQRASSAGAPPAAAPAAPRPVVPVDTPAPASTTVAPPDDDLVGETPESNPTSETVTIKLVADSSRKARVFWGRKDLGLAPLELQRPRGSGPLDLLVVAPGTLPLHTRVYTERDDKLTLRFYGESEAPGLLGYRPPADPSTQLTTKNGTKNGAKSGAGNDAAKRKRPGSNP